MRIEYHKNNGSAPWVITFAKGYWWAYPTLWKAICKLRKARKLKKTVIKATETFAVM